MSIGENRMLPDICFKMGENFSEGASGNANFGGGMSSTGEITATGTKYQSSLVSGGMVGKPVLSALAQAPVSFSIGLFDEKEQIIDLTNTAKVIFIAKEMTYADSFYINKECVITDPPTSGLITLDLTKDDLYLAGLWEAGFQLLTADGEVQGEYRIYLEIQKGMHYTVSSRLDPITIGEVRMAMFDRSPEDNSLLDDVDFKDTEIVYAIRRAVDLWNEEKPVIAGAMYSSTTFPYRYHGTEAAVAQLLIMKGNNLIRNTLHMSTGSGVLNDKERANPYISTGREMLADYRSWMRGEKHRINAHNVFGVTKRPTKAMYGSPKGGGY